MHGGGVSAGERFKVGADDRFFPFLFLFVCVVRLVVVDAQEDQRQGTARAPDGGLWRLSLLSDHAVSSLTRVMTTGVAQRAPYYFRAFVMLSIRARGTTSVSTDYQYSLM